MNARADIDLVLPCYNPPSGWEERVATHFREVERLFSPVRFHLFIVSDGSRRGYEPETIDRLRQLIPDVCVVDYKPNRGKGYALREAVKRCTSPYIIYYGLRFSLYKRLIRQDGRGVARRSGRSRGYPRQKLSG